jgi:hypothetical protein
LTSVAEEDIRYSRDGVPLGEEEGDPEEHVAGDPDFEARFQARLVEIGRRFGLDRRGHEPSEGAEPTQHPRGMRRRR